MASGLKFPWELSVQYLKGVGEKLAKQLAKHEVTTFWDLLFHLPKRYEDRRKFYTYSEIEKETESGREILSSGCIEAYQKRMAGRRRWSEAICRVDGETVRSLHFVWFQDYGGSIQKTYPVGTKVVFTGKVQAFRGRLQVVHPQMQKTESERSPWEFGTVIPVYRELSKISSRVFRRVLFRALARDELQKIPEALPEKIKEEFSFPDLSKSLRELHFPRAWDPFEDEGQNPFYRRVVFEELFMMSLALVYRKNKRQSELKSSQDLLPCLLIDPEKEKKIIEELPFQLTGDQWKVFEEIKKDISLSQAKQSMHRLVQGDVGSGKTIVAFLSMLVTAESGFQSALMAPTEILADQHFHNFQKLFPEKAHQVVILKGALKAKEKKEIRAQLKSGELLFVIGTQALVAEATHFNKLGLVIIDEQHRFGVAQRLALKDRENQYSPHFLVMTATPIPRSLALTFYGDLSLSQIKEKPQGRIPIQTHLVKRRAHVALARRLNKFLEEGRQIYMVYPLIEESEELDLKDVKSAFADWKKQFPKFQISLLHGKMKSKEKDEIMRSFKNNECQVLVSTTVIEVGVDVPNASVIVVEHAERFGLSQLHQLRGRVGRGAQESYCVLVGPDKMSELVEERLSVMINSSDGFYIAEKDLEIRGPGEFLGRRQSGVPSFKAAHILKDIELLELSRRKAQEILEADPFLDADENQKLKEMLFLWWGDKMDLSLSG